MKNIVSIWFAILVLATGVQSSAQKSHAPLSPNILTAKTVYLENHGSAKIADKIYDESKKWGRWEIVEDRSKADLFMVLSSEKGKSSSGTTQTHDPNMKTGTMTTGGWKYGTTNSVTPGSVHLELVDSKTGESLYADTGRAPNGVIRELRKRIEEREKPSKDK
jgi:hypothetical protein